MKTLVGQKAPDFTAKAVMADNGIESNFNLYNVIAGKKCVLFFYPLDFTFVCPSEIIAFNNRIGEFSSRNTKVIGVSIDSHFCHLAWKNTTLNKGGIGHIQFPLVSDLTKSISKDYGILHDDGIAFRCSVLIDEDLIVRHISVNDLPLGRDVDETLRIVDAWDHFKQYGEVCTAGWKKGKPAMQTSASGVADYLTSHADEL
jgi:peroxiredoxin (alkyl hydroperoxide reductase subunit C)